MTIAGIKLDEWFTDALFHNGSAPDMPDDIKPVRVELEKTEVEMYPGLVRRITLPAYYLTDLLNLSARS